MPVVSLIGTVTVENSLNVELLVGFEIPVVMNAIVDSVEVIIDIVVVFVECSDVSGTVILFRYDDTVGIKDSMGFADVTLSVVVDGTNSLVKGSDIEDCLVESVAEVPFVVDDCDIKETVVVEAKSFVLVDKDASVEIKIAPEDWSVEDGTFVILDVELA